MTIPHSLQRAAANLLDSQALLNDSAAADRSAKPQLRRYEVTSLLPNGNIAETRHIAPALPLFENAFTAFCRGALVETDHGPIAVEDLLPGDTILTATGETLPLLWKGRTTVIPARHDAKGRAHHLTSFMPDSLGYGKPAACIVAGPAARVLRTPAHLRGGGAPDKMLTSVTEFLDGLNIVEMAPNTPVDMFHLCLSRHAVIRIGALEFETYHPGPDALKLVGNPIRSLYMNMFSHINALCDFGPLAHPRAKESDPSQDMQPNLA